MDKAAKERADDRKAVWGERIKELRLRLGRTQAALAAELGTDETSVARWEKGTVAPKGESLYQLLEMARDIGHIWEFTGTDLESIYKAMLNDTPSLPENGLHAFLDLQLKSPAHFGDVLAAIMEHSEAVYRFFASSGPDASEIPHIYAVVTVEGPEGYVGLKTALSSLDGVSINAMSYNVGRRQDG